MSGWWGGISARCGRMMTMFGGIENVSAFCAFAFILPLDRMMWAYAWLVRWHLSLPWEDEDTFRGEVHGQ
jgi:hypothetical protein